MSSRDRDRALKEAASPRGPEEITRRTPGRAAQRNSTPRPRELEAKLRRRTDEAEAASAMAGRPLAHGRGSTAVTRRYRAPRTEATVCDLKIVFAVPSRKRKPLAELAAATHARIRASQRELSQTTCREHAASIREGGG